MGILRIHAWGSFDPIDEMFSAQKHGHTIAVDDAIRLLYGLREKSRLRDLKLLREGERPDDDFREANARGVLGAQNESTETRAAFVKSAKEDR